MFYGAHSCGQPWRRNVVFCFQSPTRVAEGLNFPVLPGRGSCRRVCRGEDRETERQHGTERHHRGCVSAPLTSGIYVHGLVVDTPGHTHDTFVYFFYVSWNMMCLFVLSTSMGCAHASQAYGVGEGRHPRRELGGCARRACAWANVFLARMFFVVHTFGTTCALRCLYLLPGFRSFVDPTYSLCWQEQRLRQEALNLTSDVFGSSSSDDQLRTRLNAVMRRVSGL